MPSLAAPAKPRLRENPMTRADRRLGRDPAALRLAGGVVDDHGRQADVLLAFEGGEGPEERVPAVAVDHDGIDVHRRRREGPVKRLNG